MESNPTGPTLEISDVHAHLQDPRFGEDLPLYVERARARGVRRIVCAGTSPGDWRRVDEIARKFEGVTPMFGLHPWNVARVSGDWLGALKISLDAAAARGAVGIGEIGLDFIVREQNFAEQEAAFRTQLELAAEREKPVAVHSVRANERTLAILGEYPKIPAVLLHGWVGTPAETARAADLGAFFSFSPRSVKPNAKTARGAIAAAPRDRILLESDAPNLLPPNGYANPTSEIATIAVQIREADGTLRAAPSGVVDLVARICEIRGVSAEDFLAQLALNERRFFSRF
ncbi:MAG: TatD family hydrolase [Thermoguttaceae bacterium]|nr:TatD family hydrolase [Thermoguttaceae bacterium]